MIGYLNALVAIVVGVALAVYGLRTAFDPYWSPPVRMVGIVGGGFGVMTVLIGVWAVTL